MSIKVIETVYRGYRFRSRTEARWAVFFDSLGIKWGYEVERFELSNGDTYLPDFTIYHDFGTSWCEVKGKQPTEAEFGKCIALATQTGDSVFIAVGIPGENHCYLCRSDTAEPQTLEMRFNAHVRMHGWLRQGYPGAFSAHFIGGTGMSNPPSASMLRSAIDVARAYRFGERRA